MGTRRNFFLAAMAILAAAIPATGAAPPTTRAAPALSAADAEVLKQLESPDFPAQVSAHEALDGLVAQSAKPAAKARLDAMFAALVAQRRAEATDVSLTLKDASARQAFVELFRQDHCAVPDESLAALSGVGRTVTVRAEHRPFWEVFRSMSAQTGVEMEDTEFTAEPRPRLYADKTLPPKGPAWMAGPYMVTADSLEHSSGITRRNGQETRWELTTLQMTGFAEPGIVILANPYSEVDVLEAKDENGNSLVPPKEGAVSEFELPGHEWGFQADLAIPKHNRGHRLVRFRALAEASIQGGTQRVEIADLLHAAPRTLQLGDRAIDFAGCRQVGDHYELTLRTEYDKWMQYYANFTDFWHSAKITDDAGDAFTLIDSKEQRDGDSVVHRFLFRQANLPKGQAGKAPSHLSWLATTQFRTVVIPIEFNDLQIKERPQP